MAARIRPARRGAVAGRGQDGARLAAPREPLPLGPDAQHDRDRARAAAAADRSAVARQRDAAPYAGRIGREPVGGQAQRGAPVALRRSVPRGGLPGARQREDEGEAGEAREEGAAHGLGSFRERGLWHRASVMERAGGSGRYIAPACDGSGHVPRPAPQRVEIRGDVALVTGAAVGIGRAIAARLADEGSAVVVGDVDAGGGRETVARIEASGGAARFVRADLTEAGEIHALVEAARTWHGTLGILVNNAGGGGHIPPHFPDAAPEQWGATLDLDLRGAMLATQLALTAMDGPGRRGQRLVVRRRRGHALPLARVRGREGRADPLHDRPAPARRRADQLRGAGLDRDRSGPRTSSRRCRTPSGPRYYIRSRWTWSPEAVVALIRDDSAAGRVVGPREGA